MEQAQPRYKNAGCLILCFTIDVFAIYRCHIVVTNTKLLALLSTVCYN